VKQIEYSPAGYWDRRYREGRSSGAGSEGNEGQYKADYVSDFIHNRDVKSVIDWGCGDGQVLELIRLEGAAYTGVDVSHTILARLRAQFPPIHGYRFDTLYDGYDFGEQRELALSMDVLFHLPDDADYFGYLGQLFGSSTRFVIIYSTNYAGGRTARHVFRREFTPDIAERFPNWELTTVETPLREGLASFFVYEKVSLCGSR
jgi:SAM-dependent methyltransferase